jgi:electron transport complex protein RnfC
MNLITIKKEYSILLKDTITEYLSPNYIYLPIEDNFDLQVNPKEYIYKGQLLYDLKYSPVSGNIKGIKECFNLYSKQKFLVIENDLKEKTKRKISIRKNVVQLSKEELLELLKEYNLDLYNRFNLDFNKIIINSIEDQPYVGNTMYININYNKEILEILDSLGQILNIDDIQIVVKDTDYNSINSLNSIIGLYPKIKLRFLPDKYLIGKKEILTEYLSIKEDFLYLNIEESYDLYNYLKRKKIKDEQIITVTGNAIKNPQIIKCKVGTSLDDILKNIIEFSEVDYDILLNSLLNNHPVSSKNIIITNNIKAIFIMKKRNIKPTECIRCGKCNDVCPFKINVFNLVNNKKCNINKCIKCGLCTYICPSYININEYLDGDSNE